MYTVDSEYKNLILDSGIRYHRHTGVPTHHLSFLLSLLQVKIYT